MTRPNPVLSFITSSCKHTYTQASHRTTVWVCVLVTQLSSSPCGLTSTSFWRIPESHPPRSQDKHFQLVSQTLQMRFNGCHRLSLSLVFLLPLSAVLPLVFLFFSQCWALSHETGKQEKLGHRSARWDRKSPKYSPAQLSSGKLLLHLNCTYNILAYNEQAWLCSTTNPLFHYKFHEKHDMNSHQESALSGTRIFYLCF